MSIDFNGGDLPEARKNNQGGGGSIKTCSIIIDGI